MRDGVIVVRELLCREVASDMFCNQGLARVVIQVTSTRVIYGEHFNNSGSLVTEATTRAKAF